ncbi:MAG: 4-(cytidine 5'-diphospho)-2-C-methyl-D-erythritol kinase [Rhodobacteraceae bacterium]|nr:4-(cytidine 5'-diphospho)-2-C-methyl-D-erythritol kinase [Paracoccaceae bacterium]
MPTELTVFAPAKINLTLHVTGRQDDGYHLLDSLVVFAGVGDTITVAPAPDLSLQIDGPEASGLAAGEDNLVLRAARFLAPDRGAAIRLTKRLPVASGIGGGSADAAAALRALSALWDLPLPTPGSTAALGADVPVCLTGQTCRMQGIGDTLLPAQIPAYDILLVNPRVAVPTSAVFKGLANRANAAMAAPPPGDPATFPAWLAAQRNDLAPPAIACAPAIADILDTLNPLGPVHAAMSGSGATCYALFPTGQGAAALDHVRSTHPHWWSAQAAIL